jgi:rod shape-determining protein MreC
VVRPIGSFLSGAVHYHDLEAENAKLRRTLDQLERRDLASAATDRTVRIITELDHLPWAGGIPTVKAMVNALSPSNFEATVQLDKGSTAGVAVGMPVVGGAGLIGQVTFVWASGCFVRLVTDVGSAVGVRFGPAGNLALVQGTGQGKALAVNLIAPGTPLQRGEVLTTSGLQHAEFPPGIPVATISGSSSQPSATQEAVSAMPTADLVQLQYVEVLQWEPSP